MEDTSSPHSDAQAIEILSQDPKLEEFVAEYRRHRETHSVIDALILTGVKFRATHQGNKPTPKRATAQSFCSVHWGKVMF
jgi:hypothetical protein